MRCYLLVKYILYVVWYGYLVNSFQLCLYDDDVFRLLIIIRYFYIYQNHDNNHIHNFFRRMVNVNVNETMKKIKSNFLEIK